MAKVKDDVPNKATELNEPKNENNNPQTEYQEALKALDKSKGHDHTVIVVNPPMYNDSPLVADTKVDAKPMGIFKAIPKIMADIGPVGKDGNNTQQNFKYRKLDDVYNAVNPALSKNNVFILPKITESKAALIQTKAGGNMTKVNLKITYTLYHADGSHLTCDVEGEAMDSGDKATNKAFSAAYKYMLLQVFCIPLEGEPDQDAESPHLTPAQNNQRQAQRGQQQRQQAKPNQGKAQAQPAQRPAAQASKHQGLAGFKIPAGKLKGKELGDIEVEQLGMFLDNYLAYIAENGLEPEPWVDKYLVPYIAQANQNPNPFV